MKIKRLRKITINSSDFKIIWSKEHDGGSFHWGKREIEIGVRGGHDESIFMVLCHELQEMVAEDLSIRMQRPDCREDYIFVYDHRQYETLMNVFSSLIRKFIV